VIEINLFEAISCRYRLNVCKLLIDIFSAMNIIEPQIRNHKTHKFNVLIVSSNL
jgi:hypothetical protein